MPVDMWVPLLITSIVSVTASSGFWAYLQARNKAQNAVQRLILGLAYDKIVTLGMFYIERGWITRDEYEDFRKYLYEPYRDCQGNGVAEQIMNQVSGLPFRTHPRYTQIDPQGREREVTPHA